jgi:hypothetical protein
MVTLLFSNVAVEASIAYAQIHTDDKVDLLLWAASSPNFTEHRRSHNAHSITQFPRKACRNELKGNWRRDCFTSRQGINFGSS